MKKYIYISFDKDLFRDVYFAILKHTRTTQDTLGLEHISCESSSIYYMPND